MVALIGPDCPGAAHQVPIGGASGFRCHGRRVLDERGCVQQHTSTTLPARVEIWSLWIDRAHNHGLVGVIQIADEEQVRLRPIRDSAQLP